MARKVLWTILFLISTSGYSQNRYTEDFMEFWNDYNENYGYFKQQGVDWEKVKSIYLPVTDTIKNDYEFTFFLAQVINELHNGHISLNQGYQESNRIIPSGSDVFAVKRGNSYFIDDIKKGSGAESAGLLCGMEITKFNGQPIGHQLSGFLPKYTTNHNEAMYSYAINMLLAGTYAKPRKYTILIKGIETTYTLPDPSLQQSNKTLEYKILDNGTGYIKINNSLGNNALIKDFDTAVDSLLHTKSIILDLTDTPSGGNTTVARAIMGRFIQKELPYQKHSFEEKPSGVIRSWVEYVTPRGIPYKNKLVVMVGHWTGSMGEGMAIGFDAMKRAKITGTKMAGLIGAIYTFTTTNTKISYQIPIECMYHINGTPREDFSPRYLTEDSDETFKNALKLAK